MAHEMHSKKRAALGASRRLARAVDALAGAGHAALTTVGLVDLHVRAHRLASAGGSALLEATGTATLTSRADFAALAFEAAATAVRGTVGGVRAHRRLATLFGSFRARADSRFASATSRTSDAASSAIVDVSVGDDTRGRALGLAAGTILGAATLRADFAGSASTVATAAVAGIAARIDAHAVTQLEPGRTLALTLGANLAARADLTAVATVVRVRVRVDASAATQ
jgi:hypothetical protein